jgi:acylphosphatase
MEKVKVHIVIRGVVQGVFFRHYTKQKAEELGLTGWVKNLPDGRVEAIFMGNKEQVEKAIEWAKKGPPRARVEGVEINWQDNIEDFNNFQIKYI